MGKGGWFYVLYEYSSDLVGDYEVWRNEMLRGCGVARMWVTISPQTRHPLLVFSVFQHFMWELVDRYRPTGAHTSSLHLCPPITHTHTEESSILTHYADHMRAVHLSCKTQLSSFMKLVKWNNLVISVFTHQWSTVLVLAVWIRVCTGHTLVTFSSSVLGAVHCYLIRQKGKPLLQTFWTEPRSGVSVTESVQSPHWHGSAFIWNSSLLFVLLRWCNM